MKKNLFVMQVKSLATAEVYPMFMNTKVEFDFLGRSMKAQMKQAKRLAAKYVLILGEDEVARGCAVLRNMSTSEQTEIPIQDITSILKTEVQSHE